MDILRLLVGLVFGRDRRLSEHFLVGAVGLFFLMVSIEYLVGLRETIQFGPEYYFWLYVGFVVAVSTVQAYLNDGIVVSIALGFAVIFGTIIIGGAATHGGAVGPLVLGLSLVFGSVLGSVGFLLGAIGRRVVDLSGAGAAVRAR